MRKGERGEGVKGGGGERGREREHEREKNTIVSIAVNIL